MTAGKEGRMPAKKKTAQELVYRERLTVEEAAACMTDTVQAIEETETLPLSQCGGRILAQDMVAQIDNPPFDRAPIDGYACRACDTAGASREHPVRLTVMEEIDAGGYSDRFVEQGQAVRIMTGAMIPAGCDCCLRQESTDYGEQEVEIYEQMKPHDNYCDKGEDFRAGTLMAARGTKLGYVEIGNLAGMGCAQVPVYRKPRIALLTTGDEVMLPGEPLRPGKIYNSNRFLLEARLKELGCEPWRVDSLPDDGVAVAAGIREAVTDGADLVITTGGVSVGKKDILHEAIPMLGAQKLFWRVKLKPGTPTIYSLYHGVPVVSLSGNPFGAITNLELLVRPMLAKMMQDESMTATVTEGIMEDAFPKASQGRRFIRAAYRDGRVHLPAGLHSSGVLSSMRGCNCLVDIAPGTEALRVGDKVKVWLL